MKFGFYHMDDVRIGNGFVWERSRVYLDKAGFANLSLSRGPWASHLGNSWVEHFDDDFAPKRCQASRASRITPPCSTAKSPSAKVPVSFSQFMALLPDLRLRLFRGLLLESNSDTQKVKV